MRHAKLHQETSRIDSNGVVGASQTIADCAFDVAPHPRFLLVSHLRPQVYQPLRQWLPIACMATRLCPVQDKGSPASTPSSSHFSQRGRTKSVQTLNHSL